MSERPVPEADALEQELPAGASPSEVEPKPADEAAIPEAPVPDSLEQSQPARDPIVSQGPVIRGDVPEADAIEQTQPAPLLDDDDEPR